MEKKLVKLPKSSQTGMGSTCTVRDIVNVRQNIQLTNVTRLQTRVFPQKMTTAVTRIYKAEEKHAL